MRSDVSCAKDTVAIHARDERAVERRSPYVSLITPRRRSFCATRVLIWEGSSMGRSLRAVGSRTCGADMTCAVSTVHRCAYVIR